MILYPDFSIQKLHCASLSGSTSFSETLSQYKHLSLNLPKGKGEWTCNWNSLQWTDVIWRSNKLGENISTVFKDVFILNQMRNKDELMPISETLVFTLLQLLLSSLAARRAHIFNLRAINSVLFKKKWYIILSLMKILLWGERQTCTLVPFQQHFFWHSLAQPKENFSEMWDPNPWSSLPEHCAYAPYHFWRHFSSTESLCLGILFWAKLEEGQIHQKQQLILQKEQFSNVCPFNLFLQLLVINRMLWV